MSGYLCAEDLADELAELAGQAKRAYAGMGEPLDDCEVRRLQSLRKLDDELGGLEESYALLIPEAEFTDYAIELADDIGAIDATAAWPACHIDWEAAARDLSMDYTPIQFDGIDYLTRG